MKKKNVSIDGRLSLCRGLCHAFAALSEDDAIAAFESMASKPLDRLDRMVREALEARNATEHSSALLDISHEIRVVSTMSRSFADARSSVTMNKNGACATSLADRCSVSVPILDIIGKGWPNISHVAANWSTDKVRFVKHSYHRGVQKPS